MQPFSYAEANSLQSALDLTAANGAMLIAGGTDMLQLLQEDVLAPRTLIGIGGLPFAGVEAGASGLRIGAMARLAAVADDTRVQQDFPCSRKRCWRRPRRRCATWRRSAATCCNARAACIFATAPLRATSACPVPAARRRTDRTASTRFSAAVRSVSPPIPAIWLWLWSRWTPRSRCKGSEGPRHIKVADFYLPPGDTPHVETALRRGEIVTGIRIPSNSFAARSHYLKVRDRASFEWALVSVAVALQCDGKR